MCVEYIIMSSSRSIAAARNRRSGDTSAPIQQQSRPNKSIGGQAAFVPQQQQQQQQTRRPGQQQIQQQQIPQVQQVQGPSAITKLSVSDAIGLVTLRLGRLEQFMFDVQAGVIETSGEARENSQVFDKSVITSIVNRIDTLEKRESASSSSSANNNAFAVQIKKLETELKDIKELLLHHIIKHEKLIVENDKKFSEIDATLDEFESKLELNHDDTVKEEDEIGGTVELEESVETSEISITMEENNT